MKNIPRGITSERALALAEKLGCSLNFDEGDAVLSHQDLPGVCARVPPDRRNVPLPVVRFLNRVANL